MPHTVSGMGHYCCMTFDIDMSHVTPMDVERTLKKLSKDLDFYTEEAVRLSDSATWLRTELDSAQRAFRVGLLTETRKLTAQEKQDLAEEATDTLTREWITANLALEACKKRLATCKEQVDIWRSIGTSVRTSLDM
jgi:hypothetical protein